MAFVDLEMFDQFALKRSVYDQTIRYLRGAGHYGVECIVVWAGAPVDDYFVIDTVYCPRQSASAVGAHVESEHVDEMYEHMYRNGRIAVAQVHSHPGEAFHSETDDDVSIVARLGALSLVVPEFAFDDAADIKHWAGFRLDNSGWKGFSPHELITLEAQSDDRA